MLIAAALPARSVQAAGPVRWYASVEEASLAARELNKPLMVDFWADWCVPCRVMEEEVYSSDQFVQAAQSFVAVRIDFDRKPAVSRKYNVSALPTILFTDSYGDELFRSLGALTRDTFAALLVSLPHDMTEFNRLNRILARDKNNLDALEGMGEHLRTAGLFRRSNEYYARSLRQKQVKANSAKREAILTEMGANYLEVKEGKLAASLFERCLKEFPSSSRRQEWTAKLIQARTLVTTKD